MSKTFTFDQYTKFSVRHGNYNTEVELQDEYALYRQIQPWEYVNSRTDSDEILSAILSRNTPEATLDYIMSSYGVDLVNKEVQKRMAKEIKKDIAEVIGDE